jgi:hypothetical protein
MARNPNIPNQKPISHDGFITWDDKDENSRKAAFAAAGKALDSIRPILRSRAFSGPNGDISVRRGMDRRDYEFFRPGESVPRNTLEIIYACMQSYRRIGIVRNIIDLMGDFVAQGIKIVHPNPQVQTFYQEWFKLVNGQDRSERFANLLYRTGNVIIKRDLAKLSQRVIDDLKKGWTSASADTDVYAYDFKPDPTERMPRNTIPWSYSFLNPQAMRIIGGELTIFSGQPIYAIELPISLVTIIRSPKNPLEKQMVDALPPYIKDAVKAGQHIIKIDPSRLINFHYKKDDWDAWADPMIYCILDDLILLQKMKLADLAALDGAISHIRIWKLGSLEHHILPTQAAIDKLNSILIHSTGGNAMDLIWGPDITVEETKTDVHNFLGDKKYIPVMNSIYAGLGIPPSLTAGASGSTGFTNNALSLRTLIERLNYGRDKLIDFWTNEIKLVQQAFGFRFPAQIQFKHTVLSDETAQNQLLINLLDRDVISLESVREHFGYIPEVEQALIKAEFRQRENGKIPHKAGPFHDAQPEFGLKKIALQSGAITPGEAGLELDEKKPDEISPLELQQDQHKHNKKIDNLKIKLKQSTPTPNIDINQRGNPNPGAPGQGRPKNSKDTKQRKQKRVVPVGASFLNLELWARDAQKALADIIHPKFLNMCNKTNMRKLTTSEVEQVEHLKYALLCNLEPFIDVNEKLVARLLSQPLLKDEEADVYWKGCIAAFIEQNKSQPTLEDIRQIQSFVYALSHGRSNV